MNSKYDLYHCWVRCKIILVFIITLTLLCSMLPINVFASASDSPSEYLCDYINDETCGYVDESEESPSNHTCDLQSINDIPDDAYNIESELTFITETIPEIETATESTPIFNINTITDNSNTISVTGPMPDDARLEVRSLTEDELAAYVAKGANVVFSYDIKIMTGGEFNETTGKYVGEDEYQPGVDNPVVVTIIPMEPIESQAEVTVVHISENETTGETTAQTVNDVSTTENGAVEFAADGFSIYIGTVLSGTTLTLAPGSGYWFYNNATCSAENKISGSFELTTNTIIYVKANENYVIKEVTIAGTGGESSSAVITNGNPATDAFDFQLTFPSEIASGTIDQLITIKTAVNAAGGTIAIDSSPSEVAGMFDATAANYNTDNLTVTSNGSSFTVTLKNDITLNGMITIDSGVTLTILSSGNHIIMRGETCETNMFYSNGGHLVLGSGGISNNTITYHYNGENADETYDIGDTIPTSTEEKFVTYTTVNARVNSTMKGTLIIDGGAVLPDYTGTKYSFPNATTDDDSKNLIKVIGGSVSIWEGITLQNNLFAGNDTEGGGAINLNNGILNMYGGTIRRCINRCSNGTTSSSYGDGGGLFLQGYSARLYMYNGSITECESDNSGAISLWSGAKLFLMGGDIHQNYALGDAMPYDPDVQYYPPQAISAYNCASMYVYGGSISDNQGKNSMADIRVSSSGTNTLHLFGGTIDKIVANSNIDNKIYIYAGQVGSVTANEPALIIRFTDEPKTVTLLNAVRADGSQTVQVEVHAGGNLTKAFSTTGTGTRNTPNASLVMQLHNGTHIVTVTSASMVKTYTVTVTNDGSSELLVSASSRVMTTPVLAAVTTNTITLATAGTGNDNTDGSLQYGYNTTGDRANVNNWQTDTSFTNLSAGTYYFYVKAEAKGSLAESVCEHSLPVTLAATVSLSLGNNILLAPGGIYIVHPIIDPEDYSIEDLIWSIKGATSPNTRIIKNDDGSGTVTISVSESTNNIIEIHAYLANTNASAKVAVVTSASTANATVEAGKSVSWSMDGYSYRWQKLNGITWENIEGETSDHYTPSLAEVGDKIRLVMTGGNPETSFYSATVTVVMNAPSYSVIIPETISMTTTSFTINGNVSGILPTQRIDVTVAPSSGDTNFELTGTNNEGSLGYALHPGNVEANAIESGDTVASFDINGNEQSKRIYYIIDNPVFSGTYTDTLTFTVMFKSGQ